MPEAELIKLLGNWPLVQLALFLVIVAGGWFGIQRTLKNRPEAAPTPPGVQMYMDGPLVSALAMLERIAKAVERISNSEARADALEIRLRELESSMAVLEDRARRT